MNTLETAWNGRRHFHDDVIKWKHFPRYWAFVRGIHRWPVNSPHKDRWRGALMFKRLSNHLWGWWFETSSCSLWLHCNGRRYLKNHFLISKILYFESNLTRNCAQWSNRYKIQHFKHLLGQAFTWNNATQGAQRDLRCSLWGFVCKLTVL